MNNIGFCVENIRNPDKISDTWKLNNSVIPISSLDIFSVRFKELIPVLVDRLSRKNVPCRTCLRNNTKSEHCAEVLATQLKNMIKYL